MEPQSRKQKLSFENPESPARGLCDDELAMANSLFSSLRLSTPSKPINSELSQLRSSPGRPVASVETAAPAVSTKEIKCPYCDESRPAELMAEHQENCEKRQIHCEACGEMVMLDIFDFHLETCSARAEENHMYSHYGFGNGEEDHMYNQYNVDNGESPVPVNNNAPEEEANEESWNGEENFENAEDEEMYGFDPDAMTYEQLIALDNTIAKKGLSAEEMKQIPIQVYLKGFDGPCSCTICISDCESGEILRKLNCGHKFHRDCIDTWLETNITCPVCKKYLR